MCIDFASKCYCQLLCDPCLLCNFRVVCYFVSLLCKLPVVVLSNLHVVLLINVRVVK